MEAVDKGNGGIFGDLWFDVLAQRCGSQYAEFLAFGLALSVGLNGSHQEIIPESGATYFSSRVLVAMILLTIYTAILSTPIKAR